jgi:hypothetical protein
MMTEIEAHVLMQSAGDRLNTPLPQVILQSIRLVQTWQRGDENPFNVRNGFFRQLRCKGGSIQGGGDDVYFGEL